jgi:membrane associated rhomboid family serine protease
MQIGVPDPAYTSSARARANFRIALGIAAAFVGFVWLIDLSDWALDLQSANFGVRPRSASGLPGILLAPLLHLDFAHLLANTPPLLALGTAMLYLYPSAVPIVLPSIWIGPGIVVWLFGRDSVHIGASGLVYGLAAYIFVAGLLRRDRRAIAASLLICFVYGALVWGVLPIKYGMSWETHLAAAVIGAILALLLRRRDIPPRRRYAYEDEPDVDPFDGEWDASGTRGDSVAHGGEAVHSGNGAARDGDSDATRRLH